MNMDQDVLILTHIFQIYWMFNLERFDYPVDWQKVSDHRKANTINKELENIHDDLNPRQLPSWLTNGVQSDHLHRKCECCGRIIADLRKLDLRADIQEQYGHYGPNVVIYFGIIKRIGFFLLFASCIFSVYSLIVNLQGDHCYRSQIHCMQQNPLFLISIYHVLDNSDIKFIQIVLMDAVCFFIILFNIYLRVYTTRKYEKINNENITDADYSILIRALPQGTQLQDIQKLIDEIKDDISSDELSQAENLFVHTIIDIKRWQACAKILNEQYKQFRKMVKDNKISQFKPEPLPEPAQSSGAVIVRFISLRANEIIDMETTMFGRFMQYCFPFYIAKTKYKVNGKKVAIERAPEPTDIIWVNFGYKNKGRIKRKVLLWFLSVIVLIIGGAVVYGLAQGEQSIKQSNGQSSFWYTVMMTVVVFIFNQLIYLFLFITTKSEKLVTKTQEKIDLFQKTVAFEVINLGFFSLFVPFLVKLPDLYGAAQNMSLPLIMLITMILQAFFVPTVNFLLIYFEVFKYWLPKLLVKCGVLILTQKSANQLFAPPTMEFFGIFSALMRFVLFGCIFSIVSPLCLPISAIGVFITLFYEKVLIQKKYSIPEYGAPNINSEFIDNLDAIPLLIGLVNLGLQYLSMTVLGYQLQSYHKTALYIIIVIGALNFIIPWNIILTNLKLIKIEADTNILYNSNAGVTYEQVYPKLGPESKQQNSKQSFPDLQTKSKQMKVRSFQRIPSTEKPQNIEDINSERMLKVQPTKITDYISKDR